MTLHDYIQSQMKEADRTQSVIAARLGISRSYLAELLSGSKRPGRKAIEKIEAATGGAVDASVWFASTPAEAKSTGNQATPRAQKDAA